MIYVHIYALAGVGKFVVQEFNNILVSLPCDTTGREA
jgi:hypothetical protein